MLQEPPEQQERPVLRVPTAKKALRVQRVTVVTQDRRVSLASLDLKVSVVPLDNRVQLDHQANVEPPVRRDQLVQRVRREHKAIAEMQEILECKASPAYSD